MVVTKLNESYIDTVINYIDHAATYDQLIEYLRLYVEAGHPDAQAITDLTNLIEDNLKGRENELRGAGPLFTGIVLMLLGLKDATDKHKRVIKRLVDTQ